MTGCSFCRTTGVTKSCPSTNACVKRIVATADEPAPITTAASRWRTPSRASAASAPARNGSVSTTSTTCSPKTIVPTAVDCASGARIQASSPHRAAAIATRTIPVGRFTRGSGDLLPGLREDVAEDADDHVELPLRGDERRRDLDDGILAIVRAADQAVLEERVRQVAAEQRLALLGGERPPRRLVFHELDRPEKACASHVADDVEVEERAQAAAELLLGVAHVIDDLLAMHDLDVLERDRASHRMAAEGDPVCIHRALVAECLEDAV